MGPPAEPGLRDLPLRRGAGPARGGPGYAFTSIWAFTRRSCLHGPGNPAERQDLHHRPGMEEPRSGRRGGSDPVRLRVAYFDAAAAGLEIGGWTAGCTTAPCDVYWR